MNENRIRKEIHRAVDLVTEAAENDPRLAERIRARARGKEEEPVKRYKFGLAVVLAVLLLLMTVAAALTNGFGLLDYYTNQAGNTAFHDLIMPLGEKWEGKYFSMEIREAAFDGMKMSFSMGVTPVEGAGRVFVIPRVMAMAGDQELETWCSAGGEYEADGFWVPDIEPLLRMEDYDLNELVYEYSLVDENVNPVAMDRDMQWTVIFDVLHTDWQIRFMETPGEDEMTEEKEAEYQKQLSDAYQRHELLLNEEGNNMETAIPHLSPYEGQPSDAEYYEEHYTDYLEDLLTKDAFTLEEKAVFSFTADRPAGIRKAREPVRLALPDGLEIRVARLEASADQVNMILEAVHTDSGEPVEIDEWNEKGWDFELRSDDAEMISRHGQCGQELDDHGEFVFRYTADYETTAPIRSVVLIPVRKGNREDVPEKPEELQVVIELE